MIRVLPSRQIGRLLARRQARLDEAEATVRPILDAVRARGDRALLEYARQFDGFTGRSIRVPGKQLAEAASALPRDFRRAVKTSAKNIRRFAELQMPRSFTK